MQRQGEKQENKRVGGLAALPKPSNPQISAMETTLPTTPSLGWAWLGRAQGALKRPLRSGLAGLCSRTVFAAFSNTFKPGFHMPSAGSARCWSLVALTGGTDPRSSSGVPAAAPRRLQQCRLG